METELQLSPTQLWDPYVGLNTAAPSPMACEGASAEAIAPASAPPPLGAAAPEDAAMAEALSTPQRKREGGESPVSTPLKQPRAASSTTGAQPTNQDILSAILALQATGNETKVLLSSLSEKVNGHELKLTGIEQRISDLTLRADGDRRKEEEERRAVQARLDALQNDMQRSRETAENQLQDLRRKIQERPMASASSSSAASSEDIVIVSGFPRESPREAVASATRDITRRLLGDANAAHSYAPFMLGSVGHVRATPEVARRLVAAARERPLFITFNGSNIPIRAAIQRPKDIRMRNKMLMDISDKVHEYFKDPSYKGEAWKTICWRSSTVVLRGRRIAIVKDLRVTFIPGWHTPDIFFATAEDIERSTHAVLNSVLRPPAAPVAASVASSIPVLR